jgi:pilus assembly protein Flp/PilA
MHTSIVRFLAEDSGATAIEYGLIAAIVSLGLMGVLTQISGSIQTMLGTVTTEINGASNP